MGRAPGAGALSSACREPGAPLARRPGRVHAADAGPLFDYEQQPAKSLSPTYFGLRPPLQPIRRREGETGRSGAQRHRSHCRKDGRNDRYRSWLATRQGRQGQTGPQSLVPGHRSARPEAERRADRAFTQAGRETSGTRRHQGRDQQPADFRYLAPA